jgi:hypothetical protein
MSKTYKFSLNIEAPKKRVHYALFAEDSPFKPKVVESKKAYKRKPKHRKDME